MSMAAIGGSANGDDKMICDMDDHGINGDMRHDAMHIAGVALEANPEEKDVSKQIKVIHFLFHNIGGNTVSIIYAVENRPILTRSMGQLGTVSLVRTSVPSLPMSRSILSSSTSARQPSVCLRLDKLSDEQIMIKFEYSATIFLCMLRL